MISCTTTGSGSWFSFCDAAAVFISVAPPAFSEACIYKNHLLAHWQYAATSNFI